MPRTTIGIVVPQDYMSMQGGLSQRVKSDLTALLRSGYDVEVTYPSRRDRLPGDVPAALTPVAYAGLNRLRFLPEKTRLLADMATQAFNPWFRSTLRNRCQRYSAIFAHLPWSVVASYQAVGARLPIFYVAHNFEYGVVEQTTANALIRELVYSVESRACRRAARVLCVSEPDMSAFEAAYGIPRARLTLVPNTVDVESFSQAHSAYDRVTERRKLGADPSSLLLLFPGRMDYAPNLDALRFIMRELVPALKNDDGVTRLMVAGSRIPRWCLRNGDETISFHPDVPDMRRFLSAADAVIVPLRVGGGTRIKILESFAAGVPVVSTGKGAEGIKCRDGQHILIAQDSGRDFLDKVKLLAGDGDLRRRLVDNAFDLVAREYDISAAGRCLAGVIEETQAQRE